MCVSDALVLVLANIGTSDIESLCRRWWYLVRQMVPYCYTGWCCIVHRIWNCWISRFGDVDSITDNDVFDSLMSGYIVLLNDDDSSFNWSFVFDFWNNLLLWHLLMGLTSWIHSLGCWCSRFFSQNILHMIHNQIFLKPCPNHIFSVHVVKPGNTICSSLLLHTNTSLSLVTYHNLGLLLLPLYNYGPALGFHGIFTQSQKFLENFAQWHITGKYKFYFYYTRVHIGMRLRNHQNLPPTCQPTCHNKHNFYTMAH